MRQILIGGILQGTRPVLLKMTKVIKNKESLKNCQTQEKLYCQLLHLHHQSLGYMKQNTNPENSLDPPRRPCFGDICRVCRSEGTPEKPLYHPCVCTGSIKFIHQECLVQWLKHSRKEYCELCKHRFAFTPIYSPDMPSRLPIQDIFAGLVTSIGTAIRYWFHYTLVAFAWLGVVPLTALVVEIGVFPLICGWWLDICSLEMFDATLKDRELSFQSAPGTTMFLHWLVGMVYVFYFASFILLLREEITVLEIPKGIWFCRIKMDNLLADCLQGCFVVTCTLCAFISLVWLREQIVHGGAPIWLEHAAPPFNAAGHHQNEAPAGGNGAENVAPDQPANPPAENAVVGENPDAQDDQAEEEEEDNEEEDDAGGEDAADANNGAQDDMNWNALEWDRAAEELTWERMLGLDGSLVFLEHVFWVVSLNTLFILVFGKCCRQLWSFFIVFGSIVLLMLWLPIRIIKSLLPNFLPYNVMLYSDAPVSELSLELLLLQVVLPALLEQGHTRQWLKGLVRAWTVTAGYLLDLHSYLLGDQEENENSANQQVNNNQHARNNNAIPVVGEGLHAAHQAILQQGGPVGFQPYRRPLNFPLRIFLLIVFMCITLLIASLICLTLPVFAGRWLMSFWTGTAKIHELYTAACGLYVCWLTIRAVTVLVAWMPQGRRVIFQKVKEWSLMIMKTLIVAVLLAGVVPLLLGLLFELVIVAPLRVPLDQTPLFYPWQDWALGVLHAKIIAAITLMGPQWWLKTVIEQVYANGIRNIDLHYIIRKLAAPVISVLLLSLCVPYVIASGVVPLLGVTAEMQNLVHRRIYPFLLMVVVLMGILSFQVRQFKRLYEHIKNDKYLVGQRLVNYERKSGKQGTSPPPPQSSQE
ncbi:E3 ubiquitin-protein ligase MARCH6 [Leptonychotes weddellii]|uniref:E3 ubiquitin-protein ligase MARCHF6 n=1 Tax=Leptonychotes weddellii TaxID=9713 RepID=A0A7F8RFB3_LEPWE|nr:E3 ubiquitin-protein ligase MARCH6 [Leptonychotes weddellii]